MIEAMTEKQGFRQTPPSVQRGSPEAVPEAFTLRPNYPNLFAAETTIPYALPQAAPVTIRVYDVLRRDLATLVEGERPAGLHQARWDGLYVVWMTASAVVRTLKVLRLR